MSHLNDLSISYVSLAPGAGKTNAAIEMMRLHMKGDLEMKRVPKYIFYVSATTLLLKQTASSLFRKIQAKKSTRKLTPNLRIAYSKKGDKVTVQEQVQNILNGRSNDGETKQEFIEGSVLFITHEAFLMLGPNHAELFQDALVLFDEARKWAEMVAPIYMDDGALDFFKKLFVRVPMGASAEQKHLTEIVARDFPENKKVKALQGCGKAAAKAFKALDELHSALNVPEGTARMRAYAFFEKSRSKSSVADTVLIQVKLPSFPFVGFSDVFILSADFKTSQMYCFLKDEGTKVLNKSQWFMNTFSKDGYAKAMRRATDRYAYIDIVALNLDASPPAINRYQRGGLMIPRHRLKALGELLDSLELSTADVTALIGRIRDPLSNPPSVKDKQIYRTLKKMGAEMEMLKWMVDKSHIVVRAWRQENPCKHKALLFLNKDFENMEASDKLFQKLNHAETVGDNSWRESNAVVFLAAVNPNPHMSRLLNARLGHLGYDPHEDFIVDRVIQATGRGNIRTHGIEDRMLIVVPTANLAQRVAERMNEDPQVLNDVTEDLGDMISWSHSLYRTVSTQDARDARAQEKEQKREAREAKKAAKPKKRIKRALTADEKKRERALYQRASRAKLAGDLKLHAKLEAERDALRFES